MTSPNRSRLMLRYFNTADRAFNRNLHDLRKLQKERQKEEIGFVPPIPMQPDPPPAVKPDAEPPAPPQIVVTQPDFSAIDPHIEPLFTDSRWNSPVILPKKAA